MDGNEHVKEEEASNSLPLSENEPKSSPGRRVRTKTTTLSREKNGKNTKWTVCRKEEEWNDIVVTAPRKSSTRIGFWTLITGVVTSLIASAIWKLGEWGFFRNGSPG